MKNKVINALMELGFSHNFAVELISKYEDYYEMGVDNNDSPEAIAETLEEQWLQDKS